MRCFYRKKSETSQTKTPVQHNGPILGATGEYKKTPLCRQSRFITAVHLTCVFSHLLCGNLKPHHLSKKNKI